jgi:hypothetical protein
MSGAMVLYSLQRLSFVGLLLAWVIHVLVGVLYLFGVPFRIHRSKPGPANPFDTHRPDDPKRGESTNPFAG